MNESYSGLVRIGGEGGAIAEVTITDLDSDSWTVDFHSGALSAKTDLQELLVRVELLEGDRAGESAWGDLELRHAEEGALMAGRSPFHLTTVGTTQSVLDD
jgi:hypothetical protein